MTVQLSDLLFTFPMEQASAAILTIADGVGLHFSGARLVHAHLLLEGAATLRCEEEPHHLQAGDFVMLARDLSYELTIGTTQKHVAAPRRDAAVPREDGLHVYHIGEGKTGAVMLSSAMGIEMAGPRAVGGVLPPIIHMRGASLLLPADASGNSASNGSREIADLCQGAGGRAFAAAIFNLLYVHTLRSCYDNLTVNETMRVHLRRRHLGVEAALRLLQKHVGAPWTVASLAEAVGMSRSAFAFAFRETVGEAPLAYLTKLRLERAASLLSGGEPRSIAEIASSVGYNSHASFDRAFRLRFAKAPKQFRPT